MKKLLGFVGLVCFAGLANAAESVVSPVALPVVLTEASYSGSGCPLGSLNLEIGADQRSAKIEMSSIATLVGNSVQKDFDLQSCNIEFQVQVAAGYHVAMAPVNYKNHVSLPYGAQSALHANYFFEYTYGISQQNFQYNWYGEQVQEYSFFFPKKDAAPFWSNCGEPFKLRVNLNLMSQTNRFKHDAKMSLNSLEGFELKVEKCR